MFCMSMDNPQSSFPSSSVDDNVSADLSPLQSSYHQHYFHMPATLEEGLESDSSLFSSCSPSQPLVQHHNSKGTIAVGTSIHHCQPSNSCMMMEQAVLDELGFAVQLDNPLSNSSALTNGRLRGEMCGIEKASGRTVIVYTISYRDEGELWMLKNLLHHRHLPKIISTWTNSLAKKLYLICSAANSGSNVSASDSHVDERQSERSLAVVAWNIAIAVNYLHSHNLVHRNLSTSAITLCSEEEGGGAIVGGLSTCKRAEPTPVFQLNTVVGDYQYLAPEIVAGMDYSEFSADMWALGVTLYTLMFGAVPFVGATIEQTCDAILHKALAFPSGASSAWVDAIKKLLERDPEKRLTAKAFLSHEIFSEIIEHIGSNENLCEDCGEDGVLFFTSPTSVNGLVSSSLDGDEREKGELPFEDQVCQGVASEQLKVSEILPLEEITLE